MGTPKHRPDARAAVQNHADEHPIDPSIESNYCEDDDYFAKLDGTATGESERRRWRSFAPYALALIGIAIAAVGADSAPPSSSVYVVGFALVALAALSYLVRPPESASRLTRALAATGAVVVVAAGFAMPLANRPDPPIQEKWGLAAPDLAPAGKGSAGASAKVAVTETSLLAVTADGLIAVDQTTGEQQWKVDGVGMIDAVTPDGYVLAIGWAAVGYGGSEQSGNFNGSTEPRTRASRRIWISPAGEALWSSASQTVFVGDEERTHGVDVSKPIASVDGILVVPQKTATGEQYVGLSPAGEVVWQVPKAADVPMDFPAVDPNAGQGVSAVLPTIALVDTTQWVGGEVTAVDAATGTPIRNVDVGPLDWSSGRSSVAVWGSYVTWQTKDQGQGCTQHGINLTDGTQWSRSLACFVGMYAIQGGWVSDATMPDQRRIDIQSGTLSSTRLPDEAAYWIGEDATAAVWVAADDGRLAAYDAVGEVLWTTQIPDVAGKVLAVRAAGGCVAVLAESATNGYLLGGDAHQARRVVALYDEADGALVGSYPIEALATGVVPLSDSTFVVFTDDRMAVYEAP